MPKIKPDQIIVVANKHKNIAGIEISYKRYGKGTPVLCFPPWPSSSLVFLPLITLLQNDFEFIAFDMPGWGGYSGSMNQKPTIDNYSQIAADFINLFKFKNYHIIGYSFGGMIAANAIKKGLLKPEKMIFASSLYSGHEIYKRYEQQIKRYEKLKNLGVPDWFMKEVFKSFVRWKLPNYSYFPEYKNTKLFKQFLKEDFMADFGSIVGLLTTLNEPVDFVGEKFKPKSLVIYADSDPEYIKTQSKELVKRLKAKELVVKDADHNHFVFDIEKSEKQMKDFLA